jgi:hypothetical protein
LRFMLGSTVKEPGASDKQVKGVKRVGLEWDRLAVKAGR